MRLVPNFAVVAALYLLYDQASVPEVSLCAVPSCTNDVNTPFEEVIESLIWVFFVGLPIPPDESLELSKELLDRIQVWRIWRQIHQLYAGF